MSQKQRFFQHDCFWLSVWMFLESAKPRRKACMASPIIDAYTGFCGRISWPAESVQVGMHAPGVAGSSCSIVKENALIQVVSPQQKRCFLPQPGEQEHLLLAGILFVDSDAVRLVRQIARCLKEARYHALPAGEYCGCFVTPHQVWFWKTRTCNETIFYTRASSHLRWSTDPGDLAASEPLQVNALLQCCAGEDIFLYQGIEWVPAGTLLSFQSAGRKEKQHIGQSSSTSLARPQRVSLPDLADRCRNALLDATRPLAQTQRPVGILLSGGIDSAAVAAALRQHGTEMLAYHFQSAHAPADESMYAQATCQALSLPLVKIAVDTDARYLSHDWRFPHPYGHAAYRWMEQAAEQACRDGISLLVTGRGGDLAFGPLRSYGLADIFSGPLTSGEKRAMILGALSTDWLLPDLLQSIRPAVSLISERSLVARAAPPARPIPFFRQQPSKQGVDIFDPMRFSPQDLVLEKTLWQPRGIRVVHPYLSPVMHHFSQSIPPVYRLLPMQGMKVTKPVLRLAWAGILPPAVLRYRRGGWVSVPHQEYCINCATDLAKLLGNQSAHVVQLGIVDPVRVQEVLSRPRDIRAWYDVLIATAMTELFLARRESR